jgi:hypothetical protein
VNPRQLKYVLGESKSSINGALVLMEYAAVPQSAHQIPKIIGASPYLETRAFELRQWTVRKHALKDVPSALAQEIDYCIYGNTAEQDSDSAAPNKAWLAGLSLADDDQLSESPDWDQEWATVFTEPQSG